jgi:D-alanine-D-alanine ligase-like ATP-grasp enzyme
MLRPSPRLLLLLPTVTYRTVAFVEAARRLGVDVTVASEQPSTFERANPTGLVTLDFADPTHAAAQARAFARAHPVHGVVAVDDDTAVVAAAIAQELGLRGNPVAAARAARDKHQQRQLLAAAGVPVPRFELLTIAADPERVAGRAAYPCVLKPLRLSASRGVVRADTPAEFVAAFERIKKILEQAGCEMRDAEGAGQHASHIPHPASRSLLVEAFVPGREVAVEGLVTRGSLQVLTIFDKPDPLDGPFFEETIYVTPSRLARMAQQEIAACAQAAVDALGLREGPIHAEIRHNDRGAWLIELAARPIGGRCSGALRFESRDAGGETREASLEEIVIRHALDMELPKLERERQASGVMMIPVPGAGVLRDVRGVGEARAVPLVEEVVITMHPGQKLVPWPEGSRYPGFIFARGGTSEAVETALRAAHARLEFLTEPAD